MFILQLICIIHWSIQLKWRNLLKLKKKKKSEACQQTSNLGCTVCRTSLWISTDSSSVAGKNRCGSKKPFKEAEALAPGRPASSQHQSVRGVQPHPPGGPCSAQRAQWDLLAGTQRCVAPQPPRPIQPPLLVPGPHWWWESCVLREGVSPAKCRGVGCHKMVSWNFRI